MSAQEIEKNIMSDIVAVLSNAGVTNVHAEHTERPEQGVFTIVRIVNMRDDLPAGNIPTGMRKADVLIDCYSYYDDDKNGALLHARLAECRAAIYRESILSVLNTASTYNSYYGFQAADDQPDEDGRYRIRSMNFTLVMKPAT